MLKFSLIVVIVFILGSILGFWVGYEERKELANFAIFTVIGQQEKRALETKLNLDMLFALEEGKSKIVKDLLSIKVKSGLKIHTKTGIAEIDRFIELGVPRKKIIKQAIEYQNKYCSDKCLGL